MTERRSKYNAKRVELDGHKFDSKAEAARYSELLLLERAGKITPPVIHPRYALLVGGRKVGTYVGDFTYFEDGHLVIEDVKGVKTAVYRLKKKLMAALYGIDIREVEA